MAHELGHLLHPEGQALCGFLSSGPNEETAANRFAAEFLLPSSGLATVVEQLVVDELLTGWHTPDRALERVARRYGVSREAASWRLEALEHLPSGFTAARRAIWSARPRYGQTRGARWQRRLSDLGVRHVRLAQQAFARSQISLGSLADALLIDIEQAYELTEATA
jgi:Zn-dependent peptidase ImmA (M78 family)